MSATLTISEEEKDQNNQKKGNLTGEQDFIENIHNDILSQPPTESELNDLKIKSEGSLKPWLVVLGSFITHFIILGILYSFGVFQQYFLSIKLSSASNVAIIGSIGLGILPFFGFFSGRLADTIGYRVTMNIGTTIIFLSLILASFSSELWHYIITQGFLLGLVSAPAFWFEKQRGLATGIAVAGSGIGGFVFGIIIEKLLVSVGLQWTLRILAIIAFVSLVFSSALIQVSKNQILENSKEKVVNSIFPRHLFKNPVFIFLFLMPFFASFGYTVPIVYIPTYVMEHLDLGSKEGALAVSLFNFASSVGRLLIGFGADKFFGRLNSYIGVYLISGLTTLLIWTFSESYAVLIFYSLSNGFFAGGIISLVPVCIPELFGMQSLASTIGLFFSAHSLGFVFGPIIAGKLLEQNINFNGGIDWKGAIYFAGGIQLVGTMFGVIAIVLYSKWRPLEKSHAENGTLGWTNEVGLVGNYAYGSGPAKNPATFATSKTFNGNFGSYAFSGSLPAGDGSIQKVVVSQTFQLPSDALIEKNIGHVFYNFTSSFVFRQGDNDYATVNYTWLDQNGLPLPDHVMQGNGSNSNVLIGEYFGFTHTDTGKAPIGINFLKVAMTFYVSTAASLTSTGFVDNISVQLEYHQFIDRTYPPPTTPRLGYVPGQKVDPPLSQTAWIGIGIGGLGVLLLFCFVPFFTCFKKETAPILKHFSLKRRNTSLRNSLRRKRSEARKTKNTEAEINATKNAKVRKVRQKKTVLAGAPNDYNV
ncbi:hypothetical protein HDU92_002534 [Lobulomyces angularis]|nr:hypothetical protein HDU92_002534 [Lobulomyces angularis]